MDTNSHGETKGLSTGERRGRELIHKSQRGNEVDWTCKSKCRNHEVRGKAECRKGDRSGLQKETKSTKGSGVCKIRMPNHEMRTGSILLVAENRFAPIPGV